jgi:hypothetical protein
VTFLDIEFLVFLRCRIDNSTQAQHSPFLHPSNGPYWAWIIHLYCVLVGLASDVRQLQARLQRFRCDRLALERASRNREPADGIQNTKESPFVDRLQGSLKRKRGKGKRERKKPRQSSPRLIHNGRSTHRITSTASSRRHPIGNPTMRPHSLSVATTSIQTLCPSRQLLLFKTTRLLFFHLPSDASSHYHSHSHSSTNPRRSPPTHGRLPL